MDKISNGMLTPFLNSIQLVKLPAFIEDVPFVDDEEQYNNEAERS